MKKHGIERQALAAALIPILILILTLILSVLLESYYIYTRIVDLDRALFDRAKLIWPRRANMPCSPATAAYSNSRWIWPLPSRM